MLYAKLVCNYVLVWVILTKIVSDKDAFRINVYKSVCIFLSSFYAFVYETY